MHLLHPFHDFISKRKIVPTFLFLLFGSLLPVFYTANAQTIELIYDEAFNRDARNAIDHLYNRNNEEAESELYVWRTKYPSHPIWLLWDGMETWWDILEDLADVSHDERFVNQMRQADYEASRLLQKEPDHADALIIKAVANSYVARMHANREEWLTSVRIGRTGFQAHQRLLEIAPELPDNLFAEGIKLYYSAYIPDEYPFLRTISWFLPDGDREAGLKALEDAADNAMFARPEANYFLAYIYLNYEKNSDKAKTYFKRLVDDYPSNGYYRRLYMRTLAQLNEYSEIIRFFEESMSDTEYSGIDSDLVTEAEMWYWKGRAQNQHGLYSDALHSFETSVATGSSLKNRSKRETYTMAAYYAGQLSEMLQHKDKARNYYSLAAEQEAAPNARKAARDRLKNL